MNTRLAFLAAIVSMLIVPSQTLAQQHQPPVHGSTHLPTPTFQPTVCNCSGNYPADGAMAHFINLPGKGVGVSIRRAGAPDGVGLGMEIVCTGMPANTFSVLVSGPQVGGPFLAARVKTPGGTIVLSNVLFDVLNPKSGSGTIFQMEQGQFGPGDVFESVYVLDDEGPVHRTFSNVSVDGVAALPNMHRVTQLNCNGWLFPPQPLAQGAACRD